MFLTKLEISVFPKVSFLLWNTFQLFPNFTRLGIVANFRWTGWQWQWSQLATVVPPKNFISMVSYLLKNRIGIHPCELWIQFNERNRGHAPMCCIGLRLVLPFPQPIQGTDSTTQTNLPFTRYFLGNPTPISLSDFGLLGGGLWGFFSKFSNSHFYFLESW